MDKRVRDLTLGTRSSLRSLLPLLAAVAVVMAAYGGWSLAERARALRLQAQRETSAYATAVGIGLEHAVADGDSGGVDAILERLARGPKSYGVLVYGADGKPLVASAPLTTAAALAPGTVLEVLRSGRRVSLERRLRGDVAFSVVRPIRAADGRVVAAFETARPLAPVERELQGMRWRLLVTTLVLMAALFVLMRWLVRRPVSRRPAAELKGVVGRAQPAPGELIHEGEDRHELERRLQETEKLAVIGQLAAGLAHQIGTPLNVIAGRAEMLLRREEDPDRQRKLRIIIEQIERITRVVRNLLGFARRREPHFERSDLGTIVDSVLELLEAELTRAQVVVERQGAAETWAFVDPFLIHDLVLNLVMNAIHALETVGAERRITVRLSEKAGGAPVTEADGAVRVIEVEDNGPGIDEAVMPHLFEPFYTTKPGGRGTGLGLPMAMAVVEEHGGMLEASNVPGVGPGTHGGALFRVTLPARLEATNA